MHVFTGSQEFNHATKLAGKIKIIVFCEIDHFTFLLLQQKLYLLCKRCLIADAAERDKNQIFLGKVFSKKLFILFRASIQ